MKFISILAICCALCGLSQSSFAQKNDLLMIRVYESMDKGYNKIVVIENDKKIEQLDLIPFYYKDLESNPIEINKILQKYKKAGYHLVSSTSGSAQVNVAASVIISTYLFEKE